MTFTLIHRERTESTNLDARAGAPGDVFTAREQTAGRGRLDHRWLARPGENLTFSAGGQLTRYGMTDEYISDMSFVVNSYSIGFGFSYKLSQKVSVKAAYFQTYYGNYDRVTKANPETGETVVGDSFTRTNRVFGVGCQLDL